MTKSKPSDKSNEVHCVEIRNTKLLKCRTIGGRVYFAKKDMKPTTLMTDRGPRPHASRLKFPKKSLVIVFFTFPMPALFQNFCQDKGTFDYL